MARGQEQHKGRSFVGLRLDGDRAADLLHEAEDLAKAEAGPFAITFGGEKRLEDPFHHLRRHAGAGVGDGYRDVLAAEAFGLTRKHRIVRADLQLATVLHCVAGVEREVEQHQLERAGVGVDRP